MKSYFQIKTGMMPTQGYHYLWCLTPAQLFSMFTLTKYESINILLRQTKHFTCGCDRCKDPTEMGTYLGSVKCTECGNFVCPGDDECGGGLCNCKPSMSQEEMYQVSEWFCAKILNLNFLILVAREMWDSGQKVDPKFWLCDMGQLGQETREHAANPQLHFQSVQREIFGT